jgi:hypothetical protein
MTSFGMIIKDTAKESKFTGKLAIVQRYTVTSVEAVLVPTNS